MKTIIYTLTLLLFIMCTAKQKPIQNYYCNEYHYKLYTMKTEWDTANNWKVYYCKNNACDWVYVDTVKLEHTGDCICR